MSEMRWVLLGGAAIVLAMIVAWTMQADSGAPVMAPAGQGTFTSSVGTVEAPAPGEPAAAPPGPARTRGERIDVKATYGNPLAAQLNRGPMVPVKPVEPEQK